jgi:hypothetical protein
VFGLLHSLLTIKFSCINNLAKILCSYIGIIDYGTMHSAFSIGSNSGPQAHPNQLRSLRARARLKGDEAARPAAKATARRSAATAIRLPNGF